MATYSFADIGAAIDGPGGNINIGAGSCTADEGITIEMSEDKSTMTTGADGCVMHSLHASKSGRVVVRFLKTSPTNALLNAMYNLQTTTAANHGRNTIVVRDPVRGDIVTCRDCAFQRHPTVAWGKDGGLLEWSWHAGKIDWVMGSGTPTAAI